MRFLLDQGISPRVGEALEALGHDAVHVRSLGMERASDPEILQRAADDDRIVITEDTDFGTLLVPSGKTRPSVILFRDRTGRASVRIQLLEASLPQVEDDLRAGAVIAIDDASARVRLLGEST